MKKFLLSFALLALALPGSAQVTTTFAGIANAIDFAYGSQGKGQALQVGGGGGTSGSYSLTLNYGYTSAGPSSAKFYPFGNSTYFPPIAIGSGATYEVVTPSSASCGPGPADQYQQCTVTATFSHAHGAGDVIRSGDGGLQEAALYQAGKGGGLVALDWRFFQANNLTTNSGLTTFLAGYDSVSANVTILNHGGITGALSYAAAAGSAYASTTHVLY